MRRTNTLIFLLVFISCCSPHLTPDQAKVKHAGWTDHTISSGVTWKYYHFDTLFNSRQSITVLEVDLDEVKTQIEYLDSGFFKTSTRAEETNAIAAVNGSFFNTKRGGSVVFFQKDGVIVTPSNDAPRAYRDNAGFAIDKSGKVSIIRKPPGGWSLMNEYGTVLSSGPLLVFERDTVSQVQEKFNTNRHPRTAVGLTKKNHLIAAVVDGRSSEAYGMTIHELATLMQALGCTVAMNLDGGGSSTAWVRAEGVVNFPSDNKKFDHEGERSVANCVVFVGVK
jgi:exopolysaccharide biosynthesis protein